MQTVVKQKLTEAGVLGVILMIVGPIIGAFSFAAIASARPTLVGPADLTWLYIVAFIGMVITVLSLPMVIVGRRYIIDSEKP